MVFQNSIYCLFLLFTVISSIHCTFIYGFLSLKIINEVTDVGLYNFGISFFCLLCGGLTLAVQGRCLPFKVPFSLLFTVTG